MEKKEEVAEIIIVSVAIITGPRDELASCFFDEEGAFGRREV